MQLKSDPLGKLVSNSEQVTPVLCLLCAVTLSGLSGALLELSFKRQGESIWAKNLFLSLFSLPTAGFAAVIDMKSSGKSYSLSSFTEGFDTAVLILILFLALGGLLTALVMKHAGALTKCYAVSLSIIICTSITAYFGLQAMNFSNVLGISLVIWSIFLYTK